MGLVRGVVQIQLLLALSFGARTGHADSTAFYYGSSIPRELWVSYDQVVVEPEHLPDPRSVAGSRAAPVAYYSVGEVAAGSLTARSVSRAWIEGENEAWSSWVMDVTDPGYQAHLFARYEALWALGYRRFFLDTLDSYELAARTPERKARARAALVTLITGMAARHPEVKLLLNRGFELLPEVAGVVHGVAAESLFDRWDASLGRYARVPESDRAWLLARLREVRDRYRLPVTVIDYRPRGERAQARATARQIQALGFEPWVTDGALASLGVGSAEVVPRRVLILGHLGADGREPEPVRLLGPIVEYLGYVPEYRAIEHGLPEPASLERYQGVVSWFSSQDVPASYAAWMREQVSAGVRFAIFGLTGFELDGEHARWLGIEVVRAATTSGVRVSARDELVGFEAEPPARPLEVPLLSFTGPKVRAHLKLTERTGGSDLGGTAVVTTAWGGAALSHVFATRGLEGERAWVIDPFAFLSRALDLPSVPRPDVTTEYGRRIAMWLIRAPGLGARTRLPGRPTTVSVLKQRLLAERRWPHAFERGLSEGAAPSGEDLEAVRAMLRSTFAEQTELPPGHTRASDSGASLTQVEGMADWRPSTPDVALPIASDLHFLPPNSPESYPYSRVLETLEYTDSPRRLKPILLDYHASAASSPGGVVMLERLYDYLETREVYPLFVSEYVARVQAFRDQVLLRHLDGSFSLRGGEALSTVRVPVELGFPDLRASRGVVGVRRLGQGQYVSFQPGPERHLVLTREAPSTPHIVQSNGVVESFHAASTDGGCEVALRIHGHAALSVQVAGLPAHARCELRSPNRRPQHERVDAHGELRLGLPHRDTGNAELVCRRAEPRR